MSIDDALRRAARCQRRYDATPSPLSLAAVNDAISRIYVAACSDAAREPRRGGG